MSDALHPFRHRHGCSLHTAHCILYNAHCTRCTLPLSTLRAVQLCTDKHTTHGSSGRARIPHFTYKTRVNTRYTSRISELWSVNVSAHFAFCTCHHTVHRSAYCARVFTMCTDLHAVHRSAYCALIGGAFRWSRTLATAAATRLGLVLLTWFLDAFSVFPMCDNARSLSSGRPTANRLGQGALDGVRVHDWSGE